MKKRYRKYTVIITLIAYLLSFTATLVHFHKINLNNDYLSGVSQSKDSNTYFHHSGLDCPIIQSFNNLHSIDNPIPQRLVTIFEEIKFKLPLLLSIKESIELSKFYLRAPPSTNFS